MTASAPPATFIPEHEYCGELDAGVEADRVWMTCTCGAVVNRQLEELGKLAGGGEAMTTVSIPCPECATTVHVEKSTYDDADELTLRCSNGHQFDYESPRGKTSIHAHKGWRFGLTATEQGGQWRARIELYQPGTAPRTNQPRLLTFHPTAPSAEEILTRAMEHAKAEIDRMIGGK